MRIVRYVISLIINVYNVMMNIMLIQITREFVVNVEQIAKNVVVQINVMNVTHYIQV